MASIWWEAMTLKPPPWLRKKAPDPGVIAEMGQRLELLSVRTICREACCPNQGECFAQGTATFLILGDFCTRRCTFCAVKKGGPLPPHPAEPERVAAAVKALRLSYAVITSVTRDDLPDGGAEQFARTIAAIKAASPETKVELLIPDFQGSPAALERVVAAGPEVVAHNVETVPRLYPRVRPQADYRRSLSVLTRLGGLAPHIPTKSGLMLGLGEQAPEVKETMKALWEAGCRVLTLGQYLPPSPYHHPLMRYVAPQEFQDYEFLGRELGFASVLSGPWVRSSYHAGRAKQGVA